MKKIAVVILNYKGWKDTLECVESLQFQDYENYKIIIIDNNSEDESIAKFRQYFSGELTLESIYFQHKPQKKHRKFIEYNTQEALQGGDKDNEKILTNDSVVLIKNDKNLGFSGGNNIGAVYAEKNNYDYVLLLNNDTVVIDKSFLSKLIHPFCVNDKAYLVGPNIINFDGTFDGPYIEDTFIGNLCYLSILNMLRKNLNCPSVYIDVNAISSPAPLSVYKVSGACMMFKTLRLKELDYLDENVWLSSEEAILSEKIRTKSGEVVFQPLTTLIHKKAQSPRPKADKYNILKNHYIQREYFDRTYRKYGPMKMAINKFVTNIRLILIRVIG